MKQTGIIEVNVEITRRKRCLKTQEGDRRWRPGKRAMYQLSMVSKEFIDEIFLACAAAVVM